MLPFVVIGTKHLKAAALNALQTYFQQASNEGKLLAYAAV